MKYLDLFTGIGGFTKAIHNAAIHCNYSEGIQQGVDEENMPSAGVKRVAAKQFSCVGFSEIDKHASAIYKFHYPHHNELGDITKIDTATLPDFDLLVGGFPCQAFSVAGKRLGFSDTRGTLFFEVARILKDKLPRYFLLENVKGLLSHDSGRTFSTIIEVLQEIGYGVSWKVLNTKDFGIPQNRERVFILGVRGEAPREILPVGRTHEKIIERDRGDKAAVATLTPGRLEKRQNGRRFKKDGEPSFTLNCQDVHGVFDGSQIRRLTPKECERLQGFPDSWTRHGVYDGEVKGMSDTQRYKCCGNAVTVKVVQTIIEQLFNPSNQITK